MIRRKTAALFEACAGIGVLSAGVSGEAFGKACAFGSNLGMIFQKRDDIIDYYDSPEIGKPTSNAMLQGKHTLPAINAENNGGDSDMLELAYKVKEQSVTQEVIDTLVEYTKSHGGIEYAERRMEELRLKCMEYIENAVSDEGIKRALTAYIDFVIERNN